jgi:hypothetical protein
VVAVSTEVNFESSEKRKKWSIFLGAVDDQRRNGNALAIERPARRALRLYTHGAFLPGVFGGSSSFGASGSFPSHTRMSSLSLAFSVSSTLCSSVDLRGSVICIFPFGRICLGGEPPFYPFGFTVGGSEVALPS